VSKRGWGSGIFSIGEAEPSSYLNTGGAIFPQPAEFFFFDTLGLVMRQLALEQLKVKKKKKR
jgi:hypothetical protein